MERFNVFGCGVEYDDSDPDGFRAGMNRFGPLIGGRELGATVYELPPGQSNCPYHYEYGNEEWALVLAGTLAVRTPGGELELAPGEVIAFPAGPEGAHRFHNHTDSTVRFLMVSTMREPCAAVYPDSDKIGFWPGEGSYLFRRGDSVDYWDGETGPAGSR